MGSTSWPAINANNATASAARGPNSASGRYPNSRCASPTSASMSASRAALSFHAIAGLPELGVIERRAMGFDHLGRTGDLTPDAAARGDQLRDGVLGGHRVIKNGGIQGTAGLARQHPRRSDYCFDRLENPVRTLRGRQPAPPIRQTLSSGVPVR